MQDSKALFLRAPSRNFLLSQTIEHGSWRKRLLVIIVVAGLTAVTLLIHYLTPLTWSVGMMRAVQSVKLAGLLEIMRVISGFGNAPKVVAIAAIALWAGNKRSEAFFLSLSGLGGWFLTMQLKHLFASPRPTADLVAVFHQWPTGSFPSGHVVFYVCFFGFLFFIAHKQLRRGLHRSLVLIGLAFLVLTVGLSRIYLGEHWPSDLPASYLFGAVWLALSLKLYRRWNHRRSRLTDWYFPYRTIVR